MSSALRFVGLAAAACLALGVSGCEAVTSGVDNALDELKKPAVITADAPFAGSPAEKFGDGADAIELPQAERVGRFSARDVAYAYRVTKRILTAAYLDRPTLEGGRPVAYARLLDPEQRKEFLKGLDHKDPEKNTRGWVASFAKGKAELVGDVIKVNGTMSARPGKDEDGNPELWVDFPYRFVYAVRKPGTDKITRVMAYDKGRIQFWRDAPGERLRHWVASSEEAWTVGVQCGTDDGFLHPVYPGEEEAGTGPTGPTMDPFADQTGSDPGNDCQNAAEI